MSNKQSGLPDNLKNNQQGLPRENTDLANRLRALTQKFQPDLAKAIADTDATIRELEEQSENTWGRIGWK